MAGSTGRHGRPDEPEEGAVAGESMGVTPTQPLPLVRREGPGSEPPVRAVAKRVPSALPALGRDEISDLPPSARAAADRRRRAREAAGAETEPGAAGAGPVVPRPRSEPEIERVPEPSTAPSGPAAAPSGPATASVPPEVELVPVGSRSREAVGVPAVVTSVEQPAPTGRHAAPTPAEPLPSPQQPPSARHSSPDPEPPTTRPAAEAPTARPAPEPTTTRDAPDHRAAALSPPPPPPPAAPPAPAPSAPAPPPYPNPPQSSEIIEATVVEETPRPYAAADAQTDEWVTVAPAAPQPPPAPGGPAAPADLPSRKPDDARPRSRRGAGRHELGGTPARPLESPRRQPPPPPSGPEGHPDTWETTPLPPVAGEYEGRRRRDRRRGRRPTMAGWLVVLGVVVALSAAIAVPFLITGGGRDRELNADPTTPTSGTTSATATVTASATGVPVIPAPTLPPSPTPEPTSAPPPATTTDAGTVQSSTTSNPPALFSLTLEAESGQRSGCAVVSTVSGVSVVDRLGERNDWPNCNGDGVVTFRGVSLPAGTFTITVYYVFGQSNSDPRRYARLRLDPPGPGNNIDFGNTYSRTTTCCQAWTTPTFTIPARTFDISFTNPGIPESNDRAPALDRIVIQQQ